MQHQRELPSITRGVEETVKEASEKVKLEMKSEDAEWVQQSLTEAKFLTGILDGARSVAEKAGSIAFAGNVIWQRWSTLRRPLCLSALDGVFKLCVFAIKPGNSLKAVCSSPNVNKSSSPRVVSFPSFVASHSKEPPIPE